MKKVLLLFFTCCALHVCGQNMQQEINEQVWKPFIQTFNDRDTKGFMALHSKDAVRSPRDAKAVWDWDEYYKHQERGDLREKSSGHKRQLELRFSERIGGNGMAIDVGIYKTTSIAPDGIAKSFYGRFHVVLRKEGGIWKILVDTDSSEGGSISEKDFLAAVPLN